MPKLFKSEDAEVTANARKYVENRYGSAFGSKASEEICKSFYFNSQSSGNFSKSIFEAGLKNINFISNQQQPPHTVIEFKAEPMVSAINENLKSGMLWENLRKTVNDINQSADEIFINTERFIQHNRIKEYRGNVLKNLTGFKVLLERGIEKNYAHEPISLSSIPVLTSTCWLNQTLRTVADPNLLAEMASSSEIEHFDIPRRLMPDLDRTSKKIFAPQYRKKFLKTGKGIIVAVIDSEVALNHPAFGDRVVHRKNYTKEPWGNPHYHGTAVAGIIASADDKYIGIAPEATIYNYKVLAPSHPLNNAEDFDGYMAIQQALEDGVDIANCSWGLGEAGDGTGRDALAFNTAWNLGLTIVKSAGNNGPEGYTLTSPADAEGVIVVGATECEGREIAEYSSRGPLKSGGLRPHLVAPGGTEVDRIFSTLMTGGFGTTGEGTSYAAPHVSGLLALILEGGDLSPDEQRNFLLSYCRKLQGFSEHAQGSGLIDFSLVQ